MIEKVGSLIKSVKKIAVLSGAGISVNAGIPDFRGKQGIYTLKKFSVDIFDIDYFFEDPKPFYDFARAIYPILEKAQPTFTHRFFTDLEQSHSVCTITQNIDLLHEKANSTNIIHLHGNIKDSYCTNCGKYFSLEEMKKLIFESVIPRCDECGGLIKPNIVFFGESVIDFDKAVKCVSDSEIFFALGTSLEVYPANMLLEYAKGFKILVNKNKTQLDKFFDYVFYEDLDEFFKKLQTIYRKEAYV